SQDLQSFPTRRSSDLKPDDNSANKILTNDGGKTWQLVAQNQAPGYRSCVQYIPGRAGKELVAIGFKGIDYSKDGGYNWKHLSDRSEEHTSELQSRENL